MAIPELRLDAFREWARIEAQVAAGPPGRRSWREVAAGLAAGVAKLALLAVLPFLALVRISVFHTSTRGRIYLSGANAKSAQVRAYYTSLHPLLRVALSTLILADEAVVITDLARRPADYAAMRLPVLDGSLHYLQRDGYAHAADLRTTGRSSVKNRLVQLYFIAMGFDTRRHTGTADHLHVELAVR